MHLPRVRASLPRIAASARRGQARRAKVIAYATKVLWPMPAGTAHMAAAMTRMTLVIEDKAAGTPRASTVTVDATVANGPWAIVLAPTTAGEGS